MIGLTVVPYCPAALAGGPACTLLGMGSETGPLSSSGAQGSYGTEAAAGTADDRAIDAIGVALGELLSEHMPLQGLSGWSGLTKCNAASTVA